MKLFCNGSYIKVFLYIKALLGSKPWNWYSKVLFIWNFLAGD